MRSGAPSSVLSIPRQSSHLFQMPYRLIGPPFVHYQNEPVYGGAGTVLLLKQHNRSAAMDKLDPERRLALSYIGERHRAALEVLWRLDAAFGDLLGNVQPIAAQLK